MFLVPLDGSVVPVTSQAPAGRSVGTVLLDSWAHSHAHQNTRPFSTSPDKHRDHLNDI